MLGHWHPHEAREGGALPERLAFYAEHGIEPVAQFEEVMERADVYICDNSSSLYEFAALGKPVVVVSPPWYRRQVHSGLRFWEALPGVEVRRPEALAETVAAVLADDSDGARLRAKAMPLAWGALDGGAAARAAAVINSCLHSESLARRRLTNSSFLPLRMWMALTRWTAECGSCPAMWSSSPACWTKW